MRPYVKKSASAVTVALLAASLVAPLPVLADQGGRQDGRAQAQSQSQNKQEQQRAEQQARERERERQEQAKREREKQAQAQAAQAARDKAARERESEREKEQREQAARQANEKTSRVLGALDTSRDERPSDHPSGKNRNDERGGSFPQGASRSNPDGGGVDKPFAVGSLNAGSQGRGDFDGNNGCGNDNDFADDNNGNCSGRMADVARATSTPEVAGVQTQPDAQPTHVKDDHKNHEDENAERKDKQDGRREVVKGAEHRRDGDHEIKRHWWIKLLEWCREVLGASKEKPEVAGTQVQAPTPTNTPTVTAPAVAPTATPQVSGAKALTDHECVPTEWHWVITQLDREQDAPRAITVTWANGQTLDVTLTKFSGKVAHYATTANLNSAVVNAAAVAPAGWSGQFNLSHGPCFGVLGTQATAEPTHTPAPTHTAVPTSTPQSTNTPAPTDTAQPSATATVVPTVTAVPTATLASGVLGKSDSGHECVTSEWHWVITQLDSQSQAPSFIRVTWTNGQVQDVPLSNYTGQTAHYATTANLSSAVTSAVAGTALPHGWTGQFNLSHGPCI